MMFNFQPKMSMENNSTYKNKDVPITVFVTYSVVMPILCIIGIIGNSLSIVILSRKTLKKSIIYAYLKGLAVVDIIYLLCVSCECIFVLHGTLWHYRALWPNETENNNYNNISLITSIHHDIVLSNNKSNPNALSSFNWNTLYYGHASESYSTEYFEFNVLPSLTSAFGTTSDIVIVFMTLNRFELVQDIGQMRAVRHKHWICYIEVLCALSFSFLCHVPCFYRYDIVPCSENVTQISLTTRTTNESSECYSHIDSTMVGTLEWRIYSILIQTVLRLLPTIMICLLNVLMYIKLRKIQKHRNKIFGLPKESTTTTSVPGTIPFLTSFNHCTLPRTFKHRVANLATSKNKEKTFNTISEVVEKSVYCFAGTANTALTDNLDPSIFFKSNLNTSQLQPKQEVDELESSVVSISTSGLIGRIRQSNFTIQRRRYNVSQKGPESFDDQLNVLESNEHISLARKKTITSMAASKRGSVSSGSHNRRELQRSIKILVMIVASHIVLSTPGNVLYILASYSLDTIKPIGEMMKEDGAASTFVTIVFNLIHILYVLNYAINYFLYCLANEEIRKETFNVYDAFKSRLARYCRSIFFRKD